MHVQQQSHRYGTYNDNDINEESMGMNQSWIFGAEAWNFDYDYKSLEASELRIVIWGLILKVFKNAISFSLK